VRAAPLSPEVQDLGLTFEKPAGDRPPASAVANPHTAGKGETARRLPSAVCPLRQ